VTTDGRYASLNCGVVIDRRGSAGSIPVDVFPRHEDTCGASADHDGIDATARWKIVAALAERLTPDIVDTISGTPTRPPDARAVGARVREVIPGLPEVERSVRVEGVVEHFSVGVPASEAAMTTLSVVPGMYPPRAVDDNPAFALAPMADPIGRIVVHDNIAIGWIVDRNGTGYHVATVDVSDSNRRRMGAVLERLALDGEAPSSAPGPVHARTGTYGAGGEMGTSELIRLGAPDAAVVLTELGANVPLPPGATFDDFIARRTKQAGVESEDGLRGTLEFAAACQWTAYWLDAQRSGDGAAMADAQAALDAVPNRPALVAPDGGGVVEMWRRIAEATRAGDRAKVGPAGYAGSCAAPGHA
jgi:hypothetical protein